MPLTLSQIRIVLSISWNDFSTITMPVILSANSWWSTTNFITIRWYKSFQWVTYHCDEFIIWQIRITFKRFLNQIFAPFHNFKISIAIFVKISIPCINLMNMVLFRYDGPHFFCFMVSKVFTASIKATLDQLNNSHRCWSTLWQQCPAKFVIFVQPSLKWY